MLTIQGFWKKLPFRDTNDHIALLARLIEAGKRVNVDVLVKKNAGFGRRLDFRNSRPRKAPNGVTGRRAVAWEHPIVRQLAIAACLRPLDIPVYFPDIEPGTADRQKAFRKHAEGAFIGITSADYCIAETATLTMKTRPGQPRSVLPAAVHPYRCDSAGTDSLESQ